jgi:hypothetical protein
MKIYSDNRVIEDRVNLEKVWATPIDTHLILNMPEVELGFFKKMIALLVKAAVVVLSGRKLYKLAI